MSVNYLPAAYGLFSNSHNDLLLLRNVPVHITATPSTKGITSPLAFHLRTLPTYASPMKHGVEVTPMEMPISPSDIDVQYSSSLSAGLTNGLDIHLPLLDIQDTSLAMCPALRRLLTQEGRAGSTDKVWVEIETLAWMLISQSRQPRRRQTTYEPPSSWTA